MTGSLAPWMAGRPGDLPSRRSSPTTPIPKRGSKRCSHASSPPARVAAVVLRRSDRADPASSPRTRDWSKSASSQSRVFGLLTFTVKSDSDGKRIAQARAASGPRLADLRGSATRGPLLSPTGRPEPHQRWLHHDRHCDSARLPAASASRRAHHQSGTVIYQPGGDAATDSGGWLLHDPRRSRPARCWNRVRRARHGRRQTRSSAGKWRRTQPITRLRKEAS